MEIGARPSVTGEQETGRDYWQKITLGVSNTARAKPLYLFQCIHDFVELRLRCIVVQLAQTLDREHFV